MPAKFDCHHDAHAVAVLEKYPTAIANKQNTDPGQTEQWWVSDNTGAILSETDPSGAQITLPTEQDAWDSAYLISVRGKTEDDIRLAAYYLYVLEGRPEGEALANWLDAKSQLEDPVVAPPPTPPTE